MKKWNAPAVEEMNISETAYNWTGFFPDGGYIGDGEISGHATWDWNESIINPKNQGGNNQGGNDTPDDGPAALS